jgi:taurine dioxygenase
MLSVEPSGKILGATIHGADLTRPMTDSEIGTILYAIGRYGMVRFPGQSLTPAQQLAFARQFGSTQRVNGHIPEEPDMSVLSNMVGEDGKPVGINDAGIIWHRDMTYHDFPGFANFLHALKIPRRNGKPLGNTEFIDSQSAFDDLPKDVKDRLRGARGVHTGAFYQSVIEKRFGGEIGKSHAKRHTKPPKLHPIVLTHPISGRETLFFDIGHCGGIDGLPEKEAQEMLEFLGEHQAQAKYEYSYEWTEGDILVWDNLRSLHRGSFDYEPHEHRLINRCQILSDKITDRDFMARVMAKVPRPAMAS